MFVNRLIPSFRAAPISPLGNSSASAFAAALSSTPSSPATPDDGAVLKIGDVLRLRRKFSEADVAEYARVTGDSNPVHFDDDFARSVTHFEKSVVHGMLVASIFPTVIASHFEQYMYPRHCILKCQCILERKFQLKYEQLI